MARPNPQPIPQRQARPARAPAGVLYCDFMEEIKRREAALNTLLTTETKLPAIVVSESCYLQLRLMCELLALGCLVAHGDIEATRSAKLEKASAADFIMHALNDLHPQFYPMPGNQVRTARGLEVVPVTSGHLTQQEFRTLYRECGENLHRGKLKNILADGSKKPNFARIREWDKKLTTLLNHHQIQLKNEDLQLWVIMNGDKGKVHSFEMTRRAGEALTSDALQPVSGQ